MSDLNRRDFLKIATLAPLAAGLGAWTLAPREAHAAEMVKLSVAKNGAPDALVKAAVEGLGGMGRFVAKGDDVVVKPNIGWDRTPEQAANTHPEVVKAVASATTPSFTAWLVTFSQLFSIAWRQELPA